MECALDDPGQPGRPRKKWSQSVASRQVVVLIDDLDGQEIAKGGETVQFALDGITYEIDLSDANAAELRETFRSYAQRGRRTGGRPVRGASLRPARTVADPEQLKAARRWLRGHGHQVSDKGRIKGELMELYLTEAGQ